jgi:hypothetical protein
VRRLLLIAAAALVLVPAASARVSLGVLGNPGRFASQTGQRSTVGHVILGWNQGNTWGARLPVQFASHGPVPMVGFTTSRGWPNPFETITPRGVAFGQGDGYLAALNHAIAGWGRMIYVRPFFELLAWFESRAGSIFDLATKPRSRAAYRRYITPLG